MVNKKNIGLHLNVKKYEQSKCFICKEKTKDIEAYAHVECCIAYSDDKEKRIKEANEKI